LDFRPGLAPQGASAPLTVNVANRSLPLNMLVLARETQVGRKILLRSFTS
jgi:hypothetical protein